MYDDHALHQNDPALDLYGVQRIGSSVLFYGPPMWGNEFPHRILCINSMENEEYWIERRKIDPDLGRMFYGELHDSAEDAEFTLDTLTSDRGGNWLHILRVSSRGGTWVARSCHTAHREGMSENSCYFAIEQYLLLEKDKLDAERIQIPAYNYPDRISGVPQNLYKKGQQVTTKHGEIGKVGYAKYVLRRGWFYRVDIEAASQDASRFLPEADITPIEPEASE